jgi:hypothetical protein
LGRGPRRGPGFLGPYPQSLQLKVFSEVGLYCYSGESSSFCGFTHLEHEAHYAAVLVPTLEVGGPAPMESPETCSLPDKEARPDRVVR